MTRRRFLHLLGTSALSSLLPAPAFARSPSVVKPERLRDGDTIGLVSPAAPIGVEAAIDADRGTITLLEPAVR
jgi:hypothetical protein